MFEINSLLKICRLIQSLHLVETSVLNTDMGTFDSSQKDESKAHSADPSKSYSKTKAFNSKNTIQGSSHSCFKTLG